MDADQTITVENDDSDLILHPPSPPKEINGFISETVKEEDREIIIEDSMKQIESFLEETKSVADGADVVDEYVSDQVMKKEEQSLDREYSAVASSDGEPEVAAVAKEEEEEEVDQVKEELEEKEVDQVKEELEEEEEKSIEAELPAVSLDRAVDDCHYENHESVQFSGVNENAAAGNQAGGGVVTTNQLVHHSSWKDCCGLFDVLRRRSNQ